MWRKYIDSSCKKIQGLIAKHIILVGFLLLAGVYGLDRLAPAGVVFDAGYCLPIVLVAWHRHVKSTMIVSALAFAANLQMTLWEAGGAPAYSLLVYRGLSSFVRFINAQGSFPACPTAYVGQGDESHGAA